MRARRYFHLVERESSEVSAKWKMFHLIFFILIAIMSLISAYAFSELFDTFNYRCVLYAKPVFVIDEIQYFNSSSNASEVTIPLSWSKKIRVRESEPEIIFADVNNENTRLRIIDYENWEEAEKISNSPYYIMNNIIFFKNNSMYGHLTLKLMRTVFATLLMCDYVLFIPLLSMVVSSFFIGIVVLYGRGGRGYVGDHVYQGWRYIYVMLVISMILFILFIVAANLANNGLSRFCAHFSFVTENKQCNSYINYFTYQTLLGYKHFHFYYLLNYYSFIFTTILWAAQMLLFCLRILCMTDFRFHTTLVRLKKKTDKEGMQENEDEEEPLWDPNESPKLYSVYRQLKQKPGHITIDEQKES